MSRLRDLPSEVWPLIDDWSGHPGVAAALDTAHRDATTERTVVAHLHHESDARALEGYLQALTTEGLKLRNLHLEMPHDSTVFPHLVDLIPRPPVVNHVGGLHRLAISVQPPMDEDSDTVNDELSDWVFDAVRFAVGLRSLTLSLRGVNDELFDNLFDVLLGDVTHLYATAATAPLPQLETLVLDVAHNALSDDALRSDRYSHIVGAIPSIVQPCCPLLRHLTLNLGHNRLGPPAVLALCELLEAVVLRQLDTCRLELGHNPALGGQAAGEVLGRWLGALRAGPRAVHVALGVAGNGLGQAGLAAMARVCEAHPMAAAAEPRAWHRLALDLSLNRAAGLAACDAAGQLVRAMLGGGGTLRVLALSLAHNPLGELSVDLVPPSVRDCRLDLTDCGLDDPALEPSIPAVRELRALDLRLGGNRLGPRWELLPGWGQALPTTRLTLDLERLLVPGCRGGGDPIRVLHWAFFTGLTSLALRARWADWEHLMISVGDMRSLQRLDLTLVGESRCVDLDLRLHVGSLKYIPNLREVALRLRGTPLGDDEGAHVVAELWSLPAVRRVRVDLATCGLSARGLALLGGLGGRPTTVRHLALGLAHNRVAAGFGDLGAIVGPLESLDLDLEGVNASGEDLRSLVRGLLETKMDARLPRLARLTLRVNPETLDDDLVDQLIHVLRAFPMELPPRLHLHLVSRELDRPAIGRLLTALVCRPAGAPARYVELHLQREYRDGGGVVAPECPAGAQLQAYRLVFHDS